MRAGELAGLEADAVVRIVDGHWLRIPLRKLRNDRYVPLHPQLTELLATWTAANLAHIRTCSYFQTTIEFRPALQRQRDHALDHDQPERAALFDRLLQ